MTAGECRIYRAIDMVRGRPGMYLGDPSPRKLLVFLRGYMSAMDHAGMKDASEPPFPDFDEWVRKQFGFRESTMGWANMILAVTLGLDPRAVNWEDFDKGATREQLFEATRRSFELLEEYRGASMTQSAESE